MAWHQANDTTAKLDATSFRSGNICFGIEEVQYQKITSVNFSMLLKMYLESLYIINSLRTFSDAYPRDTFWTIYMFIV